MHNPQSMTGGRGSVRRSFPIAPFPNRAGVYAVVQAVNVVLGKKWQKIVLDRPRFPDFPDSNGHHRFGRVVNRRSFLLLTPQDLFPRRPFLGAERVGAAFFRPTVLDLVDLCTFFGFAAGFPDRAAADFSLAATFFGLGLLMVALRGFFSAPRLMEIGGNSAMFSLGMAPLSNFSIA